MGICIELFDHDQRFEHGLTQTPFIINDHDVSSAEDLEQLNRILYTTYGGDVLSNVPTCECGDTHGDQIGVICDNCGHPVKAQTEELLEPSCWFRAPEGIAGLINMEFWFLMDVTFGRSTFSFMQWLTDPRHNPTVKPLAYVVPVERAMDERGIRRGYNSFIENFEAIFEILVNEVGMRIKEKRQGTQEMIDWLKINRELIFCQYRPLPNKAMFVVEESNMGLFVDYTILDALDAIRTIVGIDAPGRTMLLYMKEWRIAKAHALLADFQRKQYKKFYRSKGGLYRKQKYGSRAHFTGRAVATSITGPHDYKTCELPWSIGLTIFEPLIVNKLYDRGYTPVSADRLLKKYARQYNPVINEILDELTSESKYGGFMILLQRNPSLERGSAQLLCARIKRDPSDPTVGMPILDVKGWNADFDGDAMNITYLPDDHLIMGMVGLLPHKSAFNLSAPKELSSNLSLSKPSVSNLNSWMTYPLGQTDPSRLAMMAEFQ